MRKTRWKSVQPSSRSAAIVLRRAFAAKQRSPIKALSGLMTAESKLSYHWIGELINRQRQLENFCGISMASAEVGRGFSEAKLLPSRFDHFGKNAEATEGVLTRPLTRFGYQCSSVMKFGMPVLNMFNAA